MAKENLQFPRRSLAAAALIAILFVSACGNGVSPASLPQPPPAFEFLGSWGPKGNGPGQLDAPVSFATDSLGNVFFADPADSFMHKFHANGTPLFSFQDSKVKRAAGIAVDSGGAIYIANAQQGNIFVFFPDGTFLQAWRSSPQKHFSGPLGFSVDDEGHLYMPDPANSRILEFGSRGHLLKSWPAPQKAASSDERPSWVSAGSDDFVYVAYFSTGRIEKFSSDGSWVTTWIASGAPSADASPISGFAVAGDFVFTMAPSAPQIHVWTTDGKHKLDADLGENLGTIAAPQLAVTPHSELLVFDPAAPKVFRFRMNLKTQEPL
jgi:DNA-binding beta-propeller fold protein YncE